MAHEIKYISKFENRNDETVRVHILKDGYVYNENENLNEELLSSWTPDGATLGHWGSFVSDEKDIVEANYNYPGLARAYTNDLYLYKDEYYYISIYIYYDIYNGEILFDGEQYTINSGLNIITNQAYVT